jgi:dolichol-phosphate mannosyltransferase
MAFIRDHSSASAPSISILVPAMDEEKNLATTVERIVDALSITVEDYEIIIVNDGSTDGTGVKAGEIATHYPGIRVLHNQKNMGLGYCYAAGYRAATKNFFVYIPGDNTWPMRSFVELFGNLGRADVITSYASNPEVREPVRRFVSRAYTVILNLLFGHRMHYYNGLTIYPVDFLRREPATTFGFGFQAEVLLKALAQGLSYIEIPLPIDRRTAGRSKAVSLRNIASVAMTVVRLLIDLRLRAGRRRRPERPKAAPLSPADFPASQVIVIAGASAGIGQALACALAGAGHRVIGCSRDLEALRAALQDAPGATAFACDVTSESAVAQFARDVAAMHAHVDVLINCAGGFGAIGPIDQTDSAEWLDTIRANLFGPFLTVKQFLPLLERSRVPHVINFSGGGAFSPFANYSAYAASKTALVRLTETLAVELAGRGIAVNAVAPGFVPTRTHQATIHAGPEKAGLLQYRRAQALYGNRSAALTRDRLDTVIRCIEALISPDYRGLTGKTISANFDPWSSTKFREHIQHINKSELYTMRRINVVNLSEGLLRSELMNAGNQD